MLGLAPLNMLLGNLPHQELIVLVSYLKNSLFSLSLNRIFTRTAIDDDDDDDYKKTEVLPDVTPLRRSEANENRGLSEFQSEIVQLAAVLNGDHFLSRFPDEMSKKMSVKEAHEYTIGAVSRFIRASKEAILLGADESAIVDMRSSLTTRSSSVHN